MEFNIPEIEKQLQSQNLRMVKAGPSQYVIQALPHAKKEAVIVDVKDRVAFQPIRGTVRDESGNPVQGASVIVKGTKRGTVTNASGLFTIDANTGETLVISYVGYAIQEILIENLSEITTSLKPPFPSIKAK